MSLTVEVNQTGVSVIQGADTSVTVSTVGTPGSQGLQGAQGTAGSNGTQGIQGAQGITGTGTQGAQGTAGSNGTQGVQGTIGIEGPKSGLTSGSFGSGSYADQLGFTSIGEVYQWTETSVSAGRPYYVNNQHVGGGTSGFILYNNGYTNLFSGLTRAYWTFNGIPSQIAFAAIDADGVDRTAELEAATVLTIATDINNFVKYNVAHNITFGSIFTNGTYNLVQFNIVGVVSQAGTPPALAAYETDPGNISLYLGAETIGGGGSSSTAWELISYITGSQGVQGTTGAFVIGSQGPQGTSGSGTQGIQGPQGIAGSAVTGSITSTTITSIETLTSASYAAITPVSGTLYIIT